MSLTTDQFISWITDPKSVKCTLVEVVVYDGTQEKTLYLSSANYGTSAADTPANTQYLPIVKPGIEYTENLSLDGDPSISFGDISLDNYNGALDAYYSYVWVGRSIKIYLGDVTHSRNNFTLIFDGVVSDISSSDVTSINIQLRDKLQRVNASIYDTLLGNYGTKGVNNPNKNEIRPLTFGEVTNISPLLIDDATLEYMVHDGPIERIIEVRDNGVPVSFNANLNTGTFKLVAQPAGTVTCSVQGDKYSLDATGTTVATYANTVAKIIGRILTTYGTDYSKILASEIDLVNFDAFNTANPAPVGIYINSKENVISVCNQLASSIGAQLVASRSGKFRLLKITTPTSPAAITIDESFVFKDSLTLAQKLPVQSAIKLGYCKNYTVQEGVLTSIPQEHKSLYAREWMSVVATDDTVMALYKQTATPEQKDTCIITNINNQALAEAQRLLALYKVQRYTYSLKGTPNLLTLSLGDMVLLQHYRYGLSAGKYAQIISMGVDWSTGFVTLEVLI